MAKILSIKDYNGYYGHDVVVRILKAEDVKLLCV